MDYSCLKEIKSLKWQQQLRKQHSLKRKASPVAEKDQEYTHLLCSLSVAGTY